MFVSRSRPQGGARETEFIVYVNKAPLREALLPIYPLSSGKYNYMI